MNLEKNQGCLGYKILFACYSLVSSPVNGPLQQATSWILNTFMIGWPLKAMVANYALAL